MTWNLKWEGVASNYIPDHLSTSGKPGRIAHMAKEAIWEAVQTICGGDSQAYVMVTANGWEESQAPGLGQFNLSIVVKSPPDEIDKQLSDQQPADLLTSRAGDITPSGPEPASSA